MVLWEVTLATAYFLGLRRTYRLALKLQRRFIPPQRVKIRQFAHRRTRAIFDIALRVHRSIQERDLEMGRNLGNRLLRLLDRMKPSANIRGAPPEKVPGQNNLNTSVTKQASKLDQKSPGDVQRFSTKSFQKGSGRHLFSAARNTWSTSLPSITMLMRSPGTAGSTTQYRRLCSSESKFLIPNRRVDIGGVIRQDIKLWMQQN